MDMEFNAWVPPAELVPGRTGKCHVEIANALNMNTFVSEELSSCGC